MFYLTRNRSIFDAFFEDFEPIYQPRVYSSSYYDDGEKVTYYRNGIVHNESGPAITYRDTKKEPEYWLHGRQVTKADVEKLIDEKEANKVHRITVNGKVHEVKRDKLKEIEKLLS
jgi:hypothetical protein